MKNTERTVIYPGTFDPVTFGHLDVLKRALNMFDKVVVAVAANPQKRPLFDLETRVRLITENISTLENVIVVPFDGLTVDFAKEHNAVALIRGLRAVSDFDFEFQLAQMNRHLDSNIETIFLMPSPKYFYISSTLIRQVADYSAERVENFIPENVVKLLKERELLK